MAFFSNFRTSSEDPRNLRQVSWLSPMIEVGDGADQKGEHKDQL